jgi:exosortase
VTIVLAAIVGAWLYGATLAALGAEWLSSADSSYGIIVIAVAGAVAWQRRRAFACACAASTGSRSGSAVVLLTAGLVLYLAGTLGADVFITRLSFVVVLTGALAFLAGAGATRTMAPPLLFLLMAMPLPALIVNAVTLPLQLVASRLAEGLLAVAAVPVFRDGNLLVLPTATLEVEQACSGLRSLVSLSALAIVLAWATERRPGRRLAIVASALPIAIVANGLRIAATGLAIELWGPQAASPGWHTLTGWLTFVAAVAALIGVQRVLHVLMARRRSWTPGAVAA